MKPVCASGPIGKKLCEALGLDPNRVAGVSIRANVGELVHVHVSMYPTADQFEAICAELKHYTLQEADTTELMDQTTLANENRTLARAICPR
jgi:hypothetical protein